MVFHSFGGDGTTVGDSKGVHRIELVEIYRLVCISVLESTSDQILSDFTMFLLILLGGGGCGFLRILKGTESYFSWKKVFIGYSFSRSTWIELDLSWRAYCCKSFYKILKFWPKMSYARYLIFIIHLAVYGNSRFPVKSFNLQVYFIIDYNFI